MSSRHARRSPGRRVAGILLLVLVVAAIVLVVVRVVGDDDSGPGSAIDERPTGAPGTPGAGAGPSDEPAAAPGADTAAAGVPEGTVLLPSGSMIVTTPGQVVDGRDVTGDIMITADDVTIRNTRVTGDGWILISITPGVTGTRIEHVELDGRGAEGAPGSTGIIGTATVLAADIHSLENGIIPGTGSVVRDTWVHDLEASGPDPHYDGIQLDGGQSNIVIEDNTVDLTNQDQTSAVMINNDFGPVDDVVVRDNHLSGGSFTVYADAKFAGGPITGVSFVDNVLVSGGYGYQLVRETAVGWTGNIDGGDGAILRGP